LQNFDVAWAEERCPPAKIGWGKASFKRITLFPQRIKRGGNHVDILINLRRSIAPLDPGRDHRLILARAALLRLGHLKVQDL
jgi:hypothetical protein